MRLRIWLPSLTELRGDSTVPFEVLDKDRRIQHRATSLVSELPRPVDCEFVLHPTDVLLLEIRPPRLKGARLAAALPSLVEERLVGNVEEAHVVATSTNADGTAVAAVVDRALLRRALELFSRQKRRVLSAVPNPFALSYSPEKWRVRIREGAGSVRTGSSSGTAFVSDHDVPVELQLLVKHAVVVPGLVEVDGDCDTDIWSQTLETTVTQVAPEQQAPPVALELLQYQFAPGFSAGEGWRLPAVLGGILLLVMLGGLNLQAWKLRAEESALREKMKTIVEEAIPGVPAVLDPLAQLQQRVEQIRSGAGINNAEFMSIALALADVIDVDSVQSLRYRNRILSVEFVPGALDSELQRRDLVSRASDVGLTVRFADGQATVQRREGT
ncbi:MAG: hypothetical protein AMJ66_01995 [Betaproteobacteria bacterium SG8_40]|nr:MAG: hypothetical protein AMJ66_01995 [Betaproteobacteria bacterium SG8_40]